MLWQGSTFLRLPQIPSGVTANPAVPSVPREEISKTVTFPPQTCLLEEDAMELHPPPPVLALSCPALTREGQRSANPWVAGWETLWDAGRGIGRKPLTPSSDYLLQLRHAWVGCGPWGSPNPSVPTKQQWRAMVASNYLTQMSLVCSLKLHTPVPCSFIMQ